MFNKGWNCGLFLEMGVNMDDIIAVHKQVEQTLRRLKATAERAREGIVALDLEGVIQFVNAAWTQMYGYKGPDEFVGKQISALRTKGRMKTDIAGFIDRAVEKGEYAGRLECFRKDGTPFAADILIVVFKDGGGKAAGLVGFAEDLTEQEHTKEELRQFRSRLEELVSRRTEELEAKNVQLHSRAAELEQREQKLKEQADELIAENKQLRGQIRKHDRAKGELELHCDKLEQRLKEQSEQLKVTTTKLHDETTKRRRQAEHLRQKTEDLKSAGAQLQAQIYELLAGGTDGESDILKESDSVEVVVAASGDEKSVLENIFRHNMELQKPQTDEVSDKEA